MTKVFDFYKTQNWWVHRTFDDNDKKKITTCLSGSNRQIKLNDDVYDNMRQCANAMGLTVHPCFKVNPEYKKRTNLIDPELGQPLGAPEPISDSEEEDEEPPQSHRKSGRKYGKKEEKKNKQTKVVEEQTDEEQKEEGKTLFLQGQTFFRDKIKYRIDYATLASIFLSSQNNEIDTLKFMCNNFDSDVLLLLFEQINKLHNPFTKLFLDWQKLPESIHESFGLLATSPSLQYLSLRSSGLGDEQFKNLCHGLSDIKGNLTYLDVSDNHIRQDGLACLCEVLREKNKKLQFLGLGQQGFSKYEEVKPLFDYIGPKKIEGEDLIAYNNVKNEIVKIEMQNRKLYVAKKQLLPIPTVDPIKNVQEGEEQVHYLIQGSHFKTINFAFNKFTDKFKKPLQSFLLQTHSDFCLQLSYNKFKTKSRKEIKNKYRDKVIIDID